MRPLFRFGGVLVALVTSAAIGGASPPGADDTQVVHAGQSIQAAIDRAQAGDTIVVEHGTYAEDVEIHKNGIHLVGHGATIVPPSTPHPGNLCFDPTGPSLDGICVTAANVDFANNSIGSGIAGVEIRGFTIRDFSDLGILIFGGRDTHIIGNRFVNNAGYGTAAFTSTGTHDEWNVAIGGSMSEAGFYFGDSPNAAAEMEHNVSVGNLFGVFERNALGVEVEQSNIHGNCVGIVSLANSPGPAGNLNVHDNRIHDNTKFCPAHPGGDVAVNLSGIGVASVGGTGNKVHDNWITGNKPSGQVQFSGGLVVITKPGATPAVPAHNHMTDSDVRGHRTDVFWDGSGSDNLFFDNHCKTSVPGAICT